MQYIRLTQKICIPESRPSSKQKNQRYPWYFYLEIDYFQLYFLCARVTLGIMQQRQEMN